MADRKSKSDKEIELNQLSPFQERGHEEVGHFRQYVFLIAYIFLHLLCNIVGLKHNTFENDSLSYPTFEVEGLGFTRQHRN